MMSEAADDAMSSLLAVCPIGNALRRSAFRGAPTFQARHARHDNLPLAVDDHFTHFGRRSHTGRMARISSPLFGRAGIRCRSMLTSCTGISYSIFVTRRRTASFMIAMVSHSPGQR